MIVSSRKSYNSGHLSYHSSFYRLTLALMHDLACEFACAVKIRGKKLARTSLISLRTKLFYRRFSVTDVNIVQKI